MPQFDITQYPAEIFWFFVCFLVLLGGLRWSIVPLMNTLEANRQKALQKSVQEAMVLQQETEALEKKDSASLALVQKKSMDMLSKALQHKEEQRKQCLTTLREDYGGRIQNLYHVLEQEAQSWEQHQRQEAAQSLAAKFWQKIQAGVPPQAMKDLHGGPEAPVSPKAPAAKALASKSSELKTGVVTKSRAKASGKPSGKPSGKISPPGDKPKS